MPGTSGRSGWASTAPDRGRRRAPRGRIRALGLAARAPGLARRLRLGAAGHLDVSSSPAARWRCIDPLAPPDDADEVWERLDAQPPTMAVILKPDHVRDVDLFVASLRRARIRPVSLLARRRRRETELEGIEPGASCQAGSSRSTTAAGATRRRSGFPSSAPSSSPTRSRRPEASCASGRRPGTRSGRCPRCASCSSCRSST